MQKWQSNRHPEKPRLPADPIGPKNNSWQKRQYLGAIDGLCGSAGDLSKIAR
jgi:hypothetical protein